MKLCIDCKHHFVTHDYHRCKAPDNGINPVTGEGIERGCEVQRSVAYKILPSYCGEEGGFFVKKDLA
jgi:hypothetical protein